MVGLRFGAPRTCSRRSHRFPFDPFIVQTFVMNYPILPADSVAEAWQLICCCVTVLMAMLSFMLAPR